MLKEAFEYVVKTLEAKPRAQLVSVPGDGRFVYIDQGGEVTKVDVTPPLRKHTVQAVDDLIAAAKNWKANPVIWIGDKSIVLIPDDGDRRDVVTLPLVKSAAFRRLEHLAEKPVLSQIELLRTLRVDFQGAVSRADIIAAVRSLKWRQSASGNSEITQGRESLGRAVENEVTGASEIPEAVSIGCAVYSNPGESQRKYAVQCDLEVVPGENHFRFRPIPDELETVVNMALGDIRATITAALPSVPLFFGNP